MTYHPETPDIVSCFHELSPVVPSGTSPCARLRTAHPHPSSPALRIRFASTSSGRSIRARLRPPRDCCCSVGNLAVPFKTGSARDSRCLRGTWDRHLQPTSLSVFKDEHPRLVQLSGFPEEALVSRSTAPLWRAGSNHGRAFSSRTSSQPAVSSDAPSPRLPHIPLRACGFGLA
jgi:hypothetical protein